MLVVFFQYFPVGDVLTLGGGPGAYAATEGARVVVGVALGGGEFFDGAFDAYLALQLLPEEEEGYMGIGGYFFSFGTLIVSEEGEAALIGTFEEDDAGMGATGCIGGGEGHGIDLVYIGANGFVEPMVEEAQGICAGCLLVEGCLHIICADIGDIAAVVRHLFVFTIVGVACVFEAYVEELDNEEEEKCVCEYGTYAQVNCIVKGTQHQMAHCVNFSGRKLHFYG